MRPGSSLQCYLADDLRAMPPGLNHISTPPNANGAEDTLRAVAIRAL